MSSPPRPAKGWLGLESFVGIPGSVGGAVRTNAAGHGASLGQWTQRVTALTAKAKHYSSKPKTSGLATVSPTWEIES